MYSFESRVRYSEVDERAQLSLVSLVNYLQDCSTFQSEHLGIGLEHLRDNGFAWFIAAWRIDIARLPRFTERIRVSTWCYEAGRTRAGRNFLIVGEDGVPCVKADSMWFTYDTRRGRPTRIPASEAIYIEGDERLEMSALERKIAPEGACSLRDPIVVSEQHLDTNRHVNNAQYVLMAVEALGMPLDLSAIGVQYAQMAVLGDTLTPRIYEDGRGWVVELVRGDGVTSAVVRLEGSARQEASA